MRTNIYTFAAVDATLFDYVSLTASDSYCARRATLDAVCASAAFVTVKAYGMIKISHSFSP
jgi:hypothetical protein